MNKKKKIEPRPWERTQEEMRRQEHFVGQDRKFPITTIEKQQGDDEGS